MVYWFIISKASLWLSVPYPPGPHSTTSSDSCDEEVSILSFRWDESEVCKKELLKEKLIFLFFSFLKARLSEESEFLKDNFSPVWKNYLAY